MGRKPTHRVNTPLQSGVPTPAIGFAFAKTPSRITVLSIALVLLSLGINGCSSSVIRSQNPDEEVLTDHRDDVRLVRDMARAWGLRPTVIEGIGLVSQLDNTGSDPPASPPREMLLDDMKRRKVSDPNSILASESTSLVMLRAQLPAGVQKGDRLDIDVRAPSRSETKSLRGGWLMRARLQEMAVLGNRLRQGRLMGLAEGDVIADALLENESDTRSETRGRILGGSVSLVDRSLGLVLMSEHHSVPASQQIGRAVNARFHTYDRGTKRGVATPKRDSFIELEIHRRYRNNLVRYVRVVQAIPVRESPRRLIDRLAVLESQLLNPKTAKSAAVDLEAIGPEALPALRIGLQSSDPLVRFAAAEALAYQDEVDAVPALVDAARNEPAFRWHALTALSALTESDARDGLAGLLHERSDETRYGAFQALMDFNPRDPAIQGTVLNETMTLHHVPTDTEPLIHIRRSDRPEIVVFGQDVSLETPAVVFAGKRILVKSSADDRLKVSYFRIGQDNLTEYCDNDLEALIRTMVQVGGSYSDVVAAITDAKRKGSLTARVKFDALPKPGRDYQLEEEEGELPEGMDPTSIEDDPNQRPIEVEPERRVAA